MSSFVSYVSLSEQLYPQLSLRRPVILFKLIFLSSMRSSSKKNCNEHGGGGNYLTSTLRNVKLKDS